MNNEKELLNRTQLAHELWRKFLEILLIKEEAPLLYPLQARDQTLPCCSSFHLILWKVGSTQHPSNREWNPSWCKPDETEKALPLSSFSSKMGCSFRVIFSPPVDLIRARNPWLLLIYNRGKVILIMKKTRSIFSDTKIQFIIEINDTFILYRDEVSILQ